MSSSVPEQRLIKTTAFKEAGRVFLLSRLVLLSLTALTSALFHVLLPFFKSQSVALHTPYLDIPYVTDPSYLRMLFFSWYRWDAIHYVTIAYQGYINTPATAFFPFWPLLEHVGGLALGGIFPFSYYLTGVVLANLCFYLALVLLYWLIAGEFDASVARRTLYYLAFAPFALFFFAGYTESLFVLLSVAVFLLLKRGKPLDWLLAGALGFLAALTRSSGVFLAVPYIAVYFQHFWLPSERTRHTWLEKLAALAPVLLIPAGVLAYMLYLYLTKGNAFIFSSAEDSYWSRHFSWPWNTIWMVIQSFFTASSWIYLGESILQFCFTIIPLLALVLGWRRIPWHYRLFTASLTAFTLSFPLLRDSPLTSQPRYLMILFPLAVIFAIWGKNPRFHRWYMALSLAFFMIFTMFFICNLWVA